MAITNERIFGLAVPLSLADIPDRDEALRNINLEPRDLDIIDGLSSSGFDSLDLQTLSGLTVPIWRTFDRYITDVLTYNGQLALSAGVDFRVRGNVEVHGSLSATAFRYALLETFQETPVLRWGDISTSRVSSWSSIDNAIVYGADVDVNAKISVGFLNTRAVPQERTFAAEEPTHRIKLNINGFEQWFLVMKGIPIRFKGFFRDLTASVSFTGGVDPSWRIYNADGTGEIQDFIFAATGSTSTLNYGSPFSSEKYIEIYKNPEQLTSLSINNSSIQELPKSRLTNLSTLIFQNNGLIEFPNFNFFCPQVQTLRIENNPFFQSPEPEERYFSDIVGRRIPASVRTLDIVGNFKGGFAPHVLRNLTDLNRLEARRSTFNNAYFYPDSNNPDGELPCFSGTDGNVSTQSITFIDLYNNDFRTVPPGRQGGIDLNPFDPPAGETYPAKGYTFTNSGSGLTDGTYEDIALQNISSSGSGATADFIVTGGQVEFGQIKDPGSGYGVNDTVGPDPADLGGAPGTQPVIQILKVFNTLSVEQLESLVTINLSNNTSLGENLSNFNLSANSTLVTVDVDDTSLPIPNCANFGALQTCDVGGTAGDNRRSFHSGWNGYVGRAAVTNVELVDGGTGGYSSGIVAITDGDGTGLELNVTADGSGIVTGISVFIGGEDYKRDLTGTLTIPGGNGDATFNITKNAYPRTDVQNFKFLNCPELTNQRNDYSDVRGFLPKYVGCPSLVSYDFFSTNEIIAGRPGKRPVISLYSTGGVLDPLGGYTIENQNGNASPGYTPETYTVADDLTLSGATEAAVIEVVVGGNGFPSSYTVQSPGSGYVNGSQIHIPATEFNPPNKNNEDKNLIIDVISVSSGAIAPLNGSYAQGTYSLTDTGKGSYIGEGASVQIDVNSSGVVSAYSLLTPGRDYVDDEFIVVDVPLQAGGDGEVQIQIQEAEPFKILYNDQFSGNTNITSVDISINDPLFAGQIESGAFTPLNTKMSFLRLQANGRIEGNFPNLEGNSVLSSVYSASQGWSGPLPSFSSASGLSYLSLSNNSFDGEFNYTDKPNLYYINLANNNIESFSDSFFLARADFFYLNNNRFGFDADGNDDPVTGIIPYLEARIPNVEYLQLNDNNFTNYQTGSVVGLSKLRSFDLSNNKLSQGQIDQILYDFVDNYGAAPRSGVLVNLQGANMSAPSQFPPINGTLLDVNDPALPSYSNGDITNLGGVVPATPVSGVVPITRTYSNVSSTSPDGSGAVFTVAVTASAGIENVATGVNATAFNLEFTPGLIESIPGTFAWSGGSNVNALTANSYTITHVSGSSESTNGTGAQISFDIEEDGIPEGAVTVATSGDGGTAMADPYVVNETYNTTGTGNGLTIRVLSINVNGGVATAEIVNPGSGYGIPSGSETVTLGNPIGSSTPPSTNATVTVNVRRNFDPINLVLVDGGEGFTAQGATERVELNMFDAGTGADDGNTLLVDLGTIAEYTNGTTTQTTTNITNGAATGAEIQVTVVDGGYGGGITGQIVNAPDNGGYAVNDLLEVSLSGTGAGAPYTAEFQVSNVKPNWYQPGDINYEITQINNVGEGYAINDVITTDSIIDFDDNGTTVTRSLTFTVANVQQLLDKTVRRGAGAVEFLRSKGWTVQVSN